MQSSQSLNEKGKEAMHHSHYNLDSQDSKIQQLAKDHKLPWPCFVGQGASKRVGSDVYGLYVTSMAKSKTGKPIVGLTHAKTQFTTSWADGSEDCSLDMHSAKPDFWITTYGHDKMTGNDIWWRCSQDGTRLTAKNFRQLGATELGKIRLDWNGAASYKDPSF